MPVVHCTVQLRISFVAVTDVLIHCKYRSDKNVSQFNDDFNHYKDYSCVPNIGPGPYKRTGYQIGLFWVLHK